VQTQKKKHLQAQVLFLLVNEVCLSAREARLSAREVMLRIVKYLRTLVAYFTSCRALARYFTAALPLLHLGVAHASQTYM